MYILKLSYKGDNGVFHEGEFFSGFGMSYVSNYEISEPVLESEVNSVGHFSFTIYPNHPLYQFVDKPKSIIEIVRYGKNEPLFIGRMAECTTGFYNEKNAVFESELAFLLDSVRTDLASNASKNADDWLGDILSFHNDHSGNFSSVYTDNIQRKFELGKVSEKFKNESFSIPENELSGTLSTLEIISKLFLQKYGGVIKIRHENGTNLIDWLDEEDIPVLSQKIVLSENLLDIQKTKTADEIVTAIRPIGENVDSDSGKSEPLDLRRFEVPSSYYDPSGDVKQIINNKTINGDLKYTDTLYSRSLVNKYGWIQREVKFDGVTNKTGLSKAAVNYLLGVSQSESISISAVDLASVSNAIDEFRAGDVVIVNSRVHGMESRKMIVQSVSADLSDPTQSEITLGSKAVTITSQTGGTVSGVSFSGGFSGGTGRYDPEGSASAALNAAKKYTDEKTALKVDKIEGKGLSTNDYTTAEKLKLEGLSNYDDTAVKADISVLKSGKADKSSVYTKTETDSKLSGKVDKTSGMGLSQESYTTAEKSKLAGIAAGANKTVVDSSLSSTSTNPVQNKVVSANIDRLTASVNYMSEYKSNTTTVNGVISDVSKLNGRVTANETAINSNTSNINAVDARVDSLFNADVQFSKDIASINATATIAQSKAEGALSRLDNKADSVHEHAMSDITGLENNLAVIDTSLGLTYNSKNIFNPKAVNWKSYPKPTIAEDGTIISSVTSDARYWNYGNCDYYMALKPGKYIFTGITEEATEVSDSAIYVFNSNNNVLAQVFTRRVGRHDAAFEITETMKVGIEIKLFSQKVKLMIRRAEIADNTYEPYKESLQEQIDNLKQNPVVLYDSGDVTSITQVTVNGLFTNNKLLHVMITGDKYGTRQYLLPIRANINNGEAFLNIEHEDENGTQVDLVHFQKIDDNTLGVFEKQASGSEKYTRIVITKIF